MVEPAKIEKPKIVDVDSFFALEPPISEEGSSGGPPSSVFFDSAPMPGRASRFRQLFTQPPPTQAEPRRVIDRANTNPVFSAAQTSTATPEDREGFERIMAMLGGGGNKQNVPPVMTVLTMLIQFMDKSLGMQAPPPPQMSNGQGQDESKNEFFHRLLRGQNPPNGPPFNGMPRNNPPPMDYPRPPQLDLDSPRLSRPLQQPPPPHPRSPPPLDPRFFDLPPPPPPPQGGPWTHPPPGFSTPNTRFPFHGPPLSPGLPPPPPPPAGYGPPPPPGMLPPFGPPPGFPRAVYSPPLPPPPPPGHDVWQGAPPGFGFYPVGEGQR
jgi:hypothetical protein